MRQSREDRQTIPDRFSAALRTPSLIQRVNLSRSICKFSSLQYASLAVALVAENLFPSLAETNKYTSPSAESATVVDCVCRIWKSQTHFLKHILYCIKDHTKSKTHHGYGLLNSKFALGNYEQFVMQSKG